MSIQSPELFDINSPFRYNLMNFRDPRAHVVLQQTIDPNNTFKSVKIDFKGDKVRGFYLKHLLRDLEASKTSTDLSSNLIKAYETLGRTKAFKSLGITFEPDEEGTIKVVFEPQYTQRTSFGLLHSHLMDSFGLLGVLSLRNPTGLLDTISLNGIMGTYGNLKNSYFLSYLLPVFNKDYSLGFSTGRQAFFLNRGMSEDSAFQVLRMFNNRTSFQLTHSQRWNIIDPINHSREVLEEDIYPGREITLSASRIWPIVGPKKTWANVVKVKGTIGAVQGGGNFAKHEFVSHALMYPRFLNLTGRLSELCFENHLACGIAYPIFRSKLKMNDRFYRTDLPGFSEITSPEVVYDKALHPTAGNMGFEYLGDHKGDDIFLKNTMKIDFKECPILRKANIVPFLYLSYGYFSGDVMNKKLSQKPETTQVKKRYRSLVEEVKKKSRVSMGIGVFRTINNSYNLEALLNLYTLGTISDKLARFQLRLTLNE